MDGRQCETLCLVSRLISVPGLPQLKQHKSREGAPLEQRGVVRDSGTRAAAALPRSSRRGQAAGEVSVSCLTCGPHTHRLCRHQQALLLSM